MRTIYYNDEDIKKCKLALVNQKITPLQSAFLMQYITNLEEQLQQKDSTLNEIRQYVEEYTFDTYFVKASPQDILKILDNKGE